MSFRTYSIRQWLSWLPHQKSKVVRGETFYSRRNFEISSSVQSCSHGGGFNSPYVKGDNDNSTFNEGSHIIKLAFNTPSQLIGDHGIPDHFGNLKNLMYLSSTSNVFCKAYIVREILSHKQRLDNSRYSQIKKQRSLKVFRKNRTKINFKQHDIII